jgi:inward rectifier potassium channel
MERDPGGKLERVRLGSYEFKKRGISRFDLRDPYHLAVALIWPQFLAALLTFYISVNIVFAVLYWALSGSVANARSHSFADNLFFSIETLATVGYGEMYPATLYGRMVAATEIVPGLAFTAILTGLTFVRFSRPRAKLVFAANPVVAMHHGKPTLMVRIGNGRAVVLADATAKLNVLMTETSVDGELFHRAQELRLERAHIPIFPLFWTLMRVLDERSPLHGYDAARAIEADMQVFVTLEARDPTLATNGVRHPQLCGGGYPLRPTLHGCLDYGSGWNAGFGLDQNRSVGDRWRRPPGTGLDGAGRRTGIAALVRPCTGFATERS